MRWRWAKLRKNANKIFPLGICTASFIYLLYVWKFSNEILHENPQPRRLVPKWKTSPQIWDQVKDFATEKPKLLRQKTPILKNFINYSSPLENQKQLDYIAKYLDIKVVAISNENHYFYQNLEITNKGSVPIPNCCWSIYFYSPKYYDFSMVNALSPQMLTQQEMDSLTQDTDTMADSLTFNNADNTGKTTITSSLYVSHVLGYTFKLSPNSHFSSLQPGQTLTSRLLGNGWVVAKSDFIPNWYVANDADNSTVGRVIQSTKDLDVDYDADADDDDYVDANNERIYANSGMPFVKDFINPMSMIRFRSDQYQPLTPQTRFQNNKVSTFKPLPHFITPTPLYIKKKKRKSAKNADSKSAADDDDKEDVMYLQYDFEKWFVHHDAGLRREAEYLREKLGLRKPLHSGDNLAKDEKNFFALLLRNESFFEEKLSQIAVRKNFLQANYDTSSAYQLSIARRHISLTAASNQGIFYAITSLLHLIENDQIAQRYAAPPDASAAEDEKNDGNNDDTGPVDTNNNKEEGNSGPIYLPHIMIFDAARFGHRGLMMDVSRNFQSLKSLRRLVKVMAMYKMNVLHLHLADDEGWRLEIPGLPELTQVGACRGHDVEERECLMSMLGSGPGVNNKNNSNKATKYYSVKDFQKFLLFATSHHVKVVPEIDMPSHSHAALTSMKARYRKLIQEGQEEKAKEYILHDLRDRSVYMTGQFYTQSAINPCLDSTYKFVEKVISSIVQIYKDHNPLTHLHLGGDEVPDQAFTHSPLCKDLKESISKKNGKEANTHDLKTFFVHKVATIAMHHNLSVIGWQDAFNNGDGSTMKFNTGNNSGDTHTVAHYYYNNWLGGYGDVPHFLANQGMKVILSPVTHLYFDNPQEPNPDDPGLHWASRYLDIKRVFSFTAQNILNSMEEDFDGSKITRHAVCSKFQCLPLVKYKNILGMEAALWSELVRTEGRMHQMIFPRLLAVAERSWNRAAWEDYQDENELEVSMNEDWATFANRVGFFELKKLEKRKIKYYIPKPGIHIEDNLLFINTLIPGMMVKMRVLVGGRTGEKAWMEVSNGFKLQRDSFVYEVLDYGGSKDLVVNITFVTVTFDGRRKSSPVVLQHTFLATTPA